MVVLGETLTGVQVLAFAIALTGVLLATVPAIGSWRLGGKP
jgi:EamA domain-containing membrane protein RarD